MTERTSSRRAAPWGFLLAAIATWSAAAVAVPHWVIRPFRAQDPADLQLALWVVRWAPAVTLIAAPRAIAIAWTIARRPGPIARRVAAALAALVAVASAIGARVNVYETMFHSISAPVFSPLAAAWIEPGDMVLAVRGGADSRAYPVRATTFHHIVDDVVGGEPVAITYCSLCHTGIVFSRVVDGRTLTLRIGSINNQNMLMRDVETGAFWQQSTGVAVAGPLVGHSLRAARADEMTFATWAKESPRGEVLAPVARDTDEYAAADWEVGMAQRPPVKPVDGPFAPRELVLGIQVGAASGAVSVTRVLEGRVLHDTLGGVPFVLLVAPDGRSIRAFEARRPASVDPLELFAKIDAPSIWIDARRGASGASKAARSRDRSPGNACVR